MGQAEQMSCLGRSDSILTPHLLRQICAEGVLEPWGIHGLGHWARVRETGLRLAAVTGARLPVVELFAVFHDARRINDGHDPGHGARGAALAAALQGNGLRLAPEDFALLQEACAHHTKGWTAGDITVQTCWDADRLDLGRVGITPEPARLCTDAAREPTTLRWAYERARAATVPSWVVAAWGIDVGGGVL
jgi:uncharacterized protein